MLNFLLNFGSGEQLDCTPSTSSFQALMEKKMVSSMSSHPLKPPDYLQPSPPCFLISQVAGKDGALGISPHLSEPQKG